VIGAGMSVGTIFTLFVTPAVYSLLARKHDKSELFEHVPAGTEGVVAPGESLAAH
jgi:predicted Na+-dependent transporter